jgi:hypothetical protein
MSLLDMDFSEVCSAANSFHGSNVNLKELKSGSNANGAIQLLIKRESTPSPSTFPHLLRQGLHHP